MSSSLRVLLISNTRPSRTWRFAQRLIKEIPGAEVCGIVQRSMSYLPLAERAIATNASLSSSGAFQRAARQTFDAAIHGALWFIHGCPPAVNAQRRVTMEMVARASAGAGWPFLAAKSFVDVNVRDFVERRMPDLVVALGDASELPTNIEFAQEFLRANERPVDVSVPDSVDGMEIQVEYTGAACSVRLADISFPRQTKDRALGFKLKKDLVVDDLLLQAIAATRASDLSHAAASLNEWIGEMLSPYLQQATSAVPARRREPEQRWLRAVWCLCLETAILCSPIIVFRNWFRRLRGQYPVLIITHHIVTDRKHRMGISTEAFWRQVRFLQRYYRLVSLSEAAKMLRSGYVGAPTVALTFDDGYADNFVSLRAVSEEMDIPVALFITTMPVTLYQEFQHDMVKGDYGAFPMTWNQIRYWKERGAEFGSHTRTHVKCGVANRVVLEEEIAGSKKDFERELGESPAFFAFPYGNRENMPVEAIRVAQASYPHFLSCYGGENLPGRKDPPSHLFRKSSYTEPWEMELQLQSVFDIVEVIKRFLHVRLGQQPSPIQGQPRTSQFSEVESSLAFEQTGAQFVPDRAQCIERLMKPTVKISR